MSARSKSVPSIEILFSEQKKPFDNAVSKIWKKLVTLNMFKISCEFVTPASQFWPAECRNFPASGVKEQFLEDESHKLYNDSL